MKADECCKILEHVNVRPTSVRILVYQAICGLRDTFSLGDLEDELPTLDKSSIFRALVAFKEHYLIHDVEDGSGSVKYCVCHNHGDCEAGELHCHFYCNRCHKTFCLEEDAIPAVKIPEGFEARGVSYIVKGLCRECAKIGK